MTERIIQFHIHYKTQPGERIKIIFFSSTGKEIKQLYLQSFDDAYWTGILNIDNNTLYYKYAVQRKDGESKVEDLNTRILDPKLIIGKRGIIHDAWRTTYRPDSVFFSSAFKDTIFKRTVKKKKIEIGNENALTITLNAPNINHHYNLGIVGNHEMLGNWAQPHILSPNDFPVWTISFPLQHTDVDLEYKFVLCDKEGNHILKWEEGGNRKINIVLPDENGIHYFQNDEQFRTNHQEWKGAGVAIPVFSLRSENGFGIGEFSDLKLMIDFASETEMSFVQILPVNDTIANHTWKDSYPYSAISVYALNPLYVNIPSIGTFQKKKDLLEYQKDLKRLNELEEIDLVAVMARKMYFFKILFSEHKKNLKKDKKYTQFKKENAHWITSYGAFCTLRDLYQTPDFKAWPEHSVYDSKEIEEKVNTNLEFADNVEFFIFLQYHAHLQLTAATQYGRSKRIVLKGDLPIGIYRYSCDAWTAPELYNMNEQAGAPPDAYAVLGQNWGFPTYNWSEMAKNDFKWWRQRMIKLSEYFDALRIDHILGFFRIWQIPFKHVQGTMGLFNPRIPFRKDELTQYGLYGDLCHFTNPYIRDYYLRQEFGAVAELVIETFLDSNWEGSYIFKTEFSDQKSVLAYINSSESIELKRNQDKILSLMSEVLLIEEPGSNGTAFNPRITLQTTHLYQSLDDRMKSNFDRLYIDYFYHRHDEFWKRQAMWKLPALMEATNMFICGEDLGMIPASVPEVMNQLQIVSLEIQRMPKGNSAFGIPASYPYESVCSPSCHDMSTIRGWWEGNTDTAQRFYNHYMHRHGQAPLKIEMDAIKLILKDHFYANSMLAIFPIQDLLAIDEKLRKEDPFSEQINEPSNPDHYWRYRLHLTLEDLLEAKDFIKEIEKLTVQSGRGFTKK